MKELGALCPKGHAAAEDETQSWRYESTSSCCACMHGEPPGPLPLGYASKAGAVYVLVRYGDGTADLASLEEYVARREPKPVRSVRAIRGLSKAVEAACAARVLRSVQRVDEAAIERTMKQLERAYAPLPGPDDEPEAPR
jgi:hypothetical protein